MITKLKICYGCGFNKVIYKNVAGNKYCLYCYLKAYPPTPKIPVARPIQRSPKPIKQKSDKRQNEEKTYAKERKIFLTTNATCKARLINCTHEATDLHHQKGRTGTLYLDKRYWLPVCRTCHAWIELNPTDAKLLGLSMSRLETQNEQV